MNNLVVEYWFAEELEPATGAGNTPVNPDVGVLTITGFAPTIAQPQTAAPSVGTLTITGFAPSVVQNTAVAPGAGALTITGFAPTVSQSANQAVNPGVGALAITGYAPTVSQSANQALEAGAGLLTITGFAPTVVQAPASQNIAPLPGILTILGYAPTVEQSGGFVNPIIFGPGATAKQRAKAKPAYNAPNTVSVLAPTNAPVEAAAPKAKPHPDDEVVFTMLAALVAQGMFHGQAPR